MSEEEEEEEQEGPEEIEESGGLERVIEIARGRQSISSRLPELVSFGDEHGWFGAATRSFVRFPSLWEGMLLHVDGPDPMLRCRATEVGRLAEKIVGDPRSALSILDSLSVEMMGDVLRCDSQLVLRSLVPSPVPPLRLDAADRLLAVSRCDRRPPTLMVMSRAVGSMLDSRYLSDELDIPIHLFSRALEGIASRGENAPATLLSDEALRRGLDALAEIFFVSRPDVVLTRRPRMVPLCVPIPHIAIDAGTRVSTAGVFCRDADGEFGVTGCHHGTGPVGTEVRVGLKSSVVKHASEVQDLVFIPLGEGFNVPPLAGLRDVLRDREPARADRVHFSGAVNQNRSTRVFSTDVGLLRARPSVQLRVQTDPDTDQGDSGSALLDEHDRVLGFAFERTAYDDYPQFTDWIWAANALRALQLTPYTGED